MVMTGRLGSASMVVPFGSVGRVMVVMMRFLSAVWLWCGFLVHAGQHGVQPAEALLRLAPVALDPLGHQVEHLGFQVTGPTLRVALLGDQAGVLQHLEVLGDGLDGHVVRCGELADRGVTDRQPSDQVAAGGVGQGGEDPGQLVIDHGGSRSSVFN